MNKVELLNHIKGNSIYKEYEWIFHNILICETEEEAFRVLKNLGINESSYNFKLTLFKKRYHDSNPELKPEFDFLESLYIKYKKKYLVKNENANSENLFYLNVIKEIIAENSSIHDYCAKYGKFTIRQVKNMINRIKYIDNEAYNKFINNFMEPSPEFNDHIDLIVDDIISNANFDVFDYYYHTRLLPVDFINLCKRKFPENILCRVKTVVRKVQNISQTHSNLEIEIKGKTIIDGYRLTEEEQIRIGEFISLHNMPVCAYKFALRKYVAGDERLVEYVNLKQKL